MSPLRLCTRIAFAACVVATPLMAQQQPRVGRAPVLRARVEEAFLRRARRELALTDEQATRLARALEASGARRASLDDADRRARQALGDQLRPGVAADADSVARLIDAITANRVAHAESFRNEMRELGGILTSVQRGQFLLIRDRMLNQVRAMLADAPPGAARRSMP